METLESKLESLASSDEDAKDFLERYNLMKKYLSKEYYPWIQAACPYFTDHGERHINSVMHATNQLLQKYLESDNDVLSALDIFLLLSGIIWHDVGNALGREEHREKVSEISDKVKELAFPNPAIHRMVTEISKAHGGEDGLDIPIWEDRCDTEHGKYTVYSMALASVVRFTDEISENHSRISQALLNTVPDENKINWEYANCIIASHPEPTRQRVVLSIEIQKSKVLKKYLCSEFSDRLDHDGKITLIEYILCRIEKMNRERVYCSRALVRYAFIKELECRFKIYDGTDRVDGYEETVLFGDLGLTVTTYPEVEVFENFFEQHSIWKPEKIKEELQL